MLWMTFFSLCSTALKTKDLPSKMFCRCSPQNTSSSIPATTLFFRMYAMLSFIEKSNPKHPKMLAEGKLSVKSGNSMFKWLRLKMKAPKISPVSNLFVGTSCWTVSAYFFWIPFLVNEGSTTGISFISSKTRAAHRGFHPPRFFVVHWRNNPC